MRLDGWGKGEGCCLPNLECLYNIEASLIGPDMTVSVYDSTWNGLFWHSYCRMGGQEIDGEGQEEIMKKIIA